MLRLTVALNNLITNSKVIIIKFIYYLVFIIHINNYKFHAVKKNILRLFLKVITYIY